MGRAFKHPGGRADYVSGTQSRIELPRNYHAHRMQCKLEIDHDVVTSVAVLKQLGFANLINSIQVVGDGNETIKSIDIKKCIFNSITHQGKAMQSVQNTAVGTGHKSYIYFTIDFSKRGMVRPADTIENPTNYRTFDLLIDWASVVNVGTNITINSAVLTVQAQSFVNYSRNPGERTAHYVETQLKKNIEASSSELTIELPTGKRYYSLLLNSVIDGVASNAVINSVKLKSGTTVFMEINADDLRADNIDRYGITTETDADGILKLDFAERGRASDLLDTRGNFNTLQLVLDVTKQTGTNTVTVYSDVLEVLDHMEVPKALKA